MTSVSWGSDTNNAGMDEKKRRRMISNRESARKSRMKKQTHVREVTTEMSRIQRERNEISKAMDAKEERLGLLQAENDVLLAEKAALSDYLKTIQGVVNKYKQHTPTFRHAANYEVPNPSQQSPALLSASNVFRFDHSDSCNLGVHM